MSIRIKSLIFIFLILILPIIMVGIFSTREAIVGLEFLAKSQLETLVKSETTKIRTKLEFIISADKSLIHLDDVLAGFVEDDLNNAKVSENSYIFIINQKGRILVHPKREKKINRENYLYSKYPDVVKLTKKMISKDKGFSKFRDEDGLNYISYLKYNQGDVLSGSTKIEPKYELDWIICAVMPQQHVLKAANRIGYISFIVAVLSLMISMFLGFFLIDSTLIRNINKLVYATQKISKKDYLEKNKIRSNDEIGELYRSFKNMFRQIKIREAERDTVEIELQQTKKILKNIIESMPSVIISIDEKGVISQWNHAAEKFTGINSNNAIGYCLWNIAPYFVKYKKYYKEILKTKNIKKIYRDELNGYEKKYINVSLYPLEEEDINGMVLRIDDITEIEKKEDQLRQAQKMEIVGTLAGGLAHDFNNVLGGIVGTLSLMDFRVNTNDINKEEINEYIEVMKQSSMRATDIIGQLLTLSRKKELTFTNIDLNSVIKNIVKICENTFDKCIEINPIYTKQKAMVSADSIQLEQVLLNLAVNAAHAMTIMRKKDEQMGGRLGIFIDKIFADKIFCESHPEARQINYWILSISDTGVGLDSKTMTKIFNPFFTTKEKGKGTGLGLAIVYNIIHQHKGFIEVYSKQNIGTTINVFLPMIKAKEVKKVIHHKKKIPKGTGLILVVDDELVMRNLAKSILTECGYNVLLAENGKEGVELFKKHNKNLKAVLLDLIMPIKSGDAACYEMKEINKNIKILLTSGYQKDQRVQSLLKKGADMFIQKPYTLERLAVALQELNGD